MPDELEKLELHERLDAIAEWLKKIDARLEAIEAQLDELKLSE